jgi:predicted kinase
VAEGGTRGDRPAARRAVPVPAVVLSGAPGAGKSTVGRALARELGAALLDQDTATGPLVAVVADLVGVSDLADPRLAEPTRAARYETLAALAEDTLRAGTPAVLVAPFTVERRELAAWRTLERRLRAAGGAPVLVWLRLDPSLVARRLRARAARRDATKLADVERYAAALDAGPPAGPHLAVDADRPVADVVREVLVRLPR